MRGTDRRPSGDSVPLNRPCNASADSASRCLDTLPNARRRRSQQGKILGTGGRFPIVFGCIDGTRIRIQSPGTNNHELDYMDRTKLYSINEQVGVGIVDVVAATSIAPIYIIWPRGKCKL